MSNSEFPSPKLSLAFAKVVANPKSNSWSQVYNAGSFFAALSLSLAGAADEEINLPSMGKEILGNLETEFFTLEDKGLEDIKSAIEKSFSDIKNGVAADACFAYFKEDVLYIFIKGRGEIIMKRDEKLGTLLRKTDDSGEISCASGYLRGGDIIILQTDRFTKNVRENNIKQALELRLPNDIAESLSPHVHEKEDGGQAAIIIAYSGAAKVVADETIEEEVAAEKKEQFMEEKVDVQSKPQMKIPSLPKINFGLKLPRVSLSRMQKISLGAGLVIITILIGGVFFTKASQEKSKTDEIFKQVYLEAKKNVEEGQAMAKLNQSLAEDYFSKATKQIEDNIDKFKEGSKEEAEMKALLAQSKSGSMVSETVNKIEAKMVEGEDGDMLTIASKNKANAYAQDGSEVYELADKAVTTIDKKSGAKKEIIKNDRDWSEGAAISAYQGNIYILDGKNGVLKYVAGAAGYGKTSYFKTVPSEIESGRDMSIDGSVWILTKSGGIFKYTRGEKDDFAVSGLSSPLSNPIKIYTSIDIDNVYILDKGNSRIVKLGKSGNYQNEYNADIIAKAENFEIDDKEQDALVLSGGKIYQIPL